MSFGRDTALRAAAALLALRLACAAIVCGTLGLYQWLLVVWGTPGAAFGAAGVCIVLAGAVAAFALRHTPAPVVMQSTQSPPSVGQSSHLISALRDLAQDHPFAAICAAAVLGAVGGGDASDRR